MRSTKMALLFLAVLLTGCNNGRNLATQLGLNDVQSTVRDGEYVMASLYAALPLRLAYQLPGGTTPVPLSAVSASQMGPFLTAAITDSQGSCSNFIARLTAQQAGLNASGEVVSIILSGLASVFTPVATVRALAAASSIVQGSQAAINNQFFQQLTLVLFVQTMNKSYFERLGRFRADYQGSAPTELRFNAAITELQDIHRECSIPAIAARIGNTPERQVITQELVLPGEVVAGAVFTNRGATEFRKIVQIGTDWVVQGSDRDGKVQSPPVVFFRHRSPNDVAAWLGLRGFVTRVASP